MRKALVAAGLLCSGTLGISPLVLGQAAPVQAATPEAPSGSQAAASSVSGAAVVQYAMKFLGYPYTTVGNSPSTGFSCIGFVSYVFQSLGINLPDDLGGAMAFAPSVAFADLEPGDELFFQNTVWPGLSHTAIYIGGGRFVHAEWYNRGVVTSSFTNDPVDGDYWTQHYLGASRPWGGASVTVPAAPAPPIRRVRRAPVRRIFRPNASIHVLALNVRSGPSLRAGIRTVVVRGAGIRILGQRNGWDRISLANGTIGWVVGYYLGTGTTSRLGGARTTSRAASRLTARSTRVTATYQRTIGHLTVKAYGLRIHTGPALGASVIGAAGYGQHLSVLRYYGGWVKVQLSRGGIGWVSSQYVQTQAARRSTTIRSATRQTTVARTTAATRVAVNVRQQPALTSTILRVLPPGGGYNLLGWSYGWAHVRLAGGVTGWISGTVLGTTTRSSSSITPRSSSTTVRHSTAQSVVTAGVRIRSAPGLSSAVKGLVAAGTHVRVIGSSAGWTQVQLPNRSTGYIYGLYVQK